MIALWSILVALADPAVLLAPGPGELVESEAELRKRVLAAEAIGRATSRLQNATVYLDDPCEGGFLVRARTFATAWRDAAQRARVQADRTTMIAQSPTLAPLMDTQRMARIDELQARAERQAVSWLEFDALQNRSRIKCTQTLQPALGLPDPTPRAIGEEDVPVAVWVLTGTLCPGADDRTGIAVIRGPICLDLDPACACKPENVLPGAVLAP